MRLTPRLLASELDLSSAVARLHRYFYSSHGVLAHSP
jgi:hypothetical protein